MSEAKYKNGDILKHRASVKTPHEYTMSDGTVRVRTGSQRLSSEPTISPTNTKPHWLWNVTWWEVDA